MKISGTLIKGLGQAKKLGFPTLNISPRRAPKLMKPGIYAARVKTSAGEFFGVVYFGPRFSSDGVEGPRVLEVHCFGSLKISKRHRIVLELVQHIRGVKKFTNVSALKKQIARDVAHAKKILN